MLAGQILKLIRQFLIKILPHHQFFRPMMFPIYLISLVLIIGQLGFLKWDLPIHFMHAVTGLISATVILSVLSETLALQRGQDQAESLKKTRENLQAKRLKSADNDAEFDVIPDEVFENREAFYRFFWNGNHVIHMNMNRY